MKKWIFIFLLVLVSIVSCLYGILISKKHFFPYSFLKGFNTHYANDTLNWSIGIYTGTSPFKLYNPANIINPVLTSKDVNDVVASFVADPFLVKEDSIYYLFFEVLNKKTNQGDIGYAISKDGLHWAYKNIIIDEPFHLSYPYVFKWDNNYYLIPESHQDLSIRLYKATKFPTKWIYVCNLIKGYHFADPSIIFCNNKWWLFVCTNENDNLNLYYSDNLFGPWKQHPKSPVIKNNKLFARGGGRIFSYNKKIFRYSQDCSSTYGKQVFAFEITKLDTLNFEEKKVRNESIIKASGIGWNKYGMHTIAPIQLSNEKWLSAVDGY